jgi:hypothetical protein
MKIKNHLCYLNWVKWFIFFSSPLMSVDKVGMAVFPLYAPDYALPKLDMGGDSFKSSHEIF